MRFPAVTDALLDRVASHYESYPASPAARHDLGELLAGRPVIVALEGGMSSITATAAWLQKRRIRAEVKAIGTTPPKPALRVVASAPIVTARGTVKLCQRTGMQTRHFDGKCRLEPGKCECGHGHDPEAA